MTFIETYKKVLQKVNAKEGDLKTEQSIKSAINYAYQVICTKIDKKTKHTTLLRANKINTLPTDYHSLVTVLDGSRELNKLEYDVIGDLVILKSSDLVNDPELYYVYIPAALVNDSDNISVTEASKYAIVIYAAYAYYIQNSNLNSASLLLNEFNNYLQANGVEVEVNVNELQRNIQANN